MSEVWACIATGPSLAAEDIDYCRSRGWKLATCNMGFKLVPDADLFHACDAGWWERYGKEAAETLRRGCLIYSGCEYGHRITWDGTEGYSTTPGHVHGGKLSGQQLIQIVGWQQPRAIVMLGYDNQHTGGKAHCHDDYPAPMRNAYEIESTADTWQALYSQCPYPLVNCSRETAITAVPRVTLEAVWQEVEAASLGTTMRAKTSCGARR